MARQVKAQPLPSLDGAFQADPRPLLLYLRAFNQESQFFTMGAKEQYGRWAKSFRAAVARRSEDRTYSRGVFGVGPERSDRAVCRARQSGRLSCAAGCLAPARQGRRVEDALRRAGTARSLHHRRSQQVGQPAQGVRALAQRRVRGKTVPADATVEGRNRASSGPFGKCCVAHEGNPHHHVAGIRDRLEEAGTSSSSPIRAPEPCLASIEGAKDSFSPRREIGRRIS